MDFRIVDVYLSSGQLVVTAEHFNPDGSAWFTEHYTWQGREGLKQKRATNALGQLLQDDNTVAPTRVTRRGPPDETEQFLEAGKTWKLRPGPHMVDDSILSTIRSIHRQRLATGWPQGKIDQLPTFKSGPADNLGSDALKLRFQGLIGHQE